MARAVNVDPIELGRTLALEDAGFQSTHLGDSRRPKMRVYPGRPRSFESLQATYAEPTPEEAKRFRDEFRRNVLAAIPPVDSPITQACQRALQEIYRRRETFLHLMWFGTDSMLSVAAELEAVE